MATLYNPENLNNIIMECGPETYPKPTDMYNSDGTKKYAFVTLVMLGDKYTAGAIVLADSLKLAGTKADLVVLVTNDVSDEAKRILGMFFDHVIEVSYIPVSNWRTKKQKHRKYLDFVFTKFHVFDLVQYKKIVLLDADAIMLKHVDHLFTLNAPAGVYFPDKNDIIKYDKKGNYILPTDGKFAWYEKYCECCKHGNIIPKEITDKLFKEPNNSGISGGIIVLEPKVGELDDIIVDVTKGKMAHLINNVFIWPEQQYLTLRYSGKWTSINPRFLGLQGYPHWSILFALQYAGDKPFIIDSKQDIETRSQYPDFVLWHQYFQKILKEYPDLKTKKSLEEAVEMNKLIHTKLNRIIKRIEPSDEIKRRIANIYKMSYHRVNERHIKYYQINQEIHFRPIKNLHPMFLEMQEYDYQEPIKRLSEYYKDSGSNYFENLYNKIKNITFQTIQLNKIKEYQNNTSIADMDQIMLQYIKSRPKTFVLTLWTKVADFGETISQDLGQHGIISYTKEISLTWKGVQNLMYEMYDDFTHQARMEFIKKKMEYCGISESGKNKIFIIWFDNINDEKISGQGSDFKKIIRNKILELTNLNKDKNIRGNDVLHINDHYYQTIEYSQFLLNKNSLDMFEFGDCENYINLKDGFLKFNTLRNWFYTNLTQLELNRLVILGGTLFYCFGFRTMSDIDGLLVPANKSQTEIELEELINSFMTQKETRIPFVDIGVEGSTYWKASWSEKNQEVLDKFNIKNFSEVAFDPAHHWYRQGIKLYKLDFEIIRKINRIHKTELVPQLASDFSDLIMLYFKKRLLLKNYIFLNENQQMVLDGKSLAETKISPKLIYALFEKIKEKYGRKNEISKETLTKIL